jgi:hypothetical protein
VLGGFNRNSKLIQIHLKLALENSENKTKEITLSFSLVLAWWPN